MEWLSEIPVTPVVKATASKLHRRRALSGSTAKAYAAIAEVALLYSYGQRVRVDHLVVRDGDLDLIPEDNSGRRIRIVVEEEFPCSVHSGWLDVDLCVFILQKGKAMSVCGWLTTDEIEEAPVKWVIHDGERKGYSHQVSPQFLIEMPSKFDFTEACSHLEDYGGIWDYRQHGWECCGCGRRIYSVSDRERVRREDARLGYQVPSES